ncbi:hypothetical protein M8J77_015853 [Diaphorina citri]|nr:hypothetical protein M8J77_015853 [Diaphorina citri]
MWRAHKRNTNEVADIVNLFSWQTNLWHQAKSRQLKFRRIKTPRKENIALVFITSNDAGTPQCNAIRVVVSTSCDNNG